MPLWRGWTRTATRNSTISYRGNQRKHRVGERVDDLAQPGTDLLNRGLPQGYRTLLTALAVKMDARWPVDYHIDRYEDRRARNYDRRTPTVADRPQPARAGISAEEEEL